MTTKKLLKQRDYAKIKEAFTNPFSKISYKLMLPTAKDAKIYKSILLLLLKSPSKLYYYTLSRLNRLNLRRSLTVFKNKHRHTI